VPAPYRIEPLGPHHDRKHSCGVPALDRYFREQTRRAQSARGIASPMSLTFTEVPPPRQNSRDVDRSAAYLSSEAAQCAALIAPAAVPAESPASCLVGCVSQIDRVMPSATPTNAVLAAKRRILRSPEGAVSTLAQGNALGNAVQIPLSPERAFKDCL
jgi:hypothetical protein